MRNPLKILPAAFLLLLAVRSNAHAQPVIGSRAAALGGAESALYGGKWALFGNPANADTLGPSLSFFGMRYYGLPELTDLAASGSLPTGAGVFSAGFHSYGDERYREQQFRVGWKGTFERFHLGVAAAWHHVALGGGYGSDGTPTLHAGITAEVARKVLLGMRLVNLNGGAWETAGGDPEELPRLMGVGLSYRPGQGTLFLCEWVATPDHAPEFRIGMEFSVAPGVRLRAGAASRPRTLSGGFSYEGRRWGAGLAVQRHPDPLLGYSPGVDFHLNL